MQTWGEHANSAKKSLEWKLRFKLGTFLLWAANVNRCAWVVLDVVAFTCLMINVHHLKPREKCLNANWTIDLWPHLRNKQHTLRTRRSNVSFFSLDAHVPGGPLDSLRALDTFLPRKPWNTTHRHTQLRVIQSLNVRQLWEEHYYGYILKNSNSSNLHTKRSSVYSKQTYCTWRKTNVAISY